MYQVYTDGACIGNPGPGGWAAIVVDNGTIRMLSGGNRSTTNNRMEITAVIEGLKAVPESSDVTVFSDSQYVVFTMTRGWKRNRNHDLWEVLDDLVSKRKVYWEWVRGHVGHPLNEMADRLAHQEAKNGVRKKSRSRPDSR